MTERQPIEGQGANGDFLLLRDVSELEVLPKDAKALHFVGQSLMAIGTMRRVLDTFPQLEIVQVVPARRRLAGKAFMDVLEQRGVRLVIGRVQGRSGERSDVTDRYERLREQFWQKIREDSEFRAIITKAKVYKLLEARVAFKYFDRRPELLDEIAQELGITYLRAERALRVVEHLMGWQSRDEAILARERSIKRYCARREEEEKKAIKTRDKRRRYKVGDLWPPEELSKAKYREWRRMVKALAANEGILERIRQEDEKMYRALVNFFQIEGHYDGRNMEDLAKFYGKSEAWMRMLKDKALERLGVEKRH